MQTEDEQTHHDGIDDEIVAGPANDLVGTLFAEKYRIESVLGQGGMSVVYLARHEAMQKLMAVKTLHTHLVSRNSSLLRFKQEAKAASSLSHPGIVAIHDYGITDEGIPYLAMDYVDGEPLSDLIQRVGRLLPAHAVQIFVQAAEAIAHAHQNKIIHRDIKPSNIMVKHSDTGSPEVKIVDFGVAKLMTDEDPNKLTQTGEAVGSPLYMSPEQCMGQQLDARSDVYSFGCVMYEALTGRPAFGAESVFGTMFKQMNEMPPSFESVDAKIKMSQLERIVFKAIAKEPDKRFQSMSEMRSQLALLLESSNRGAFKRIKDQLELKVLRASPITTDKRFAIPIVLSLITLGALIWAGVAAVSAAVPSRASLDNILLWGPFPDRTHAPSNQNTVEEEAWKERWASGAVPKIKDLTNEELNPKAKMCAALGIAEQRLTLASSLRRRGNYKTAVPEFQEAIKIAKSSGVDDKLCVEQNQAEHIYKDAYYGLGDSLYFLGRYEEAIEPYRAKVALERRLSTIKVRRYAYNREERLAATVKLGDCYYERRDFGLAKNTFREAWNDREAIEAIGPNPSVALLFCKMGDTFGRFGDYTNALYYYGRAERMWAKLGESSAEGAVDADRYNVLTKGMLADLLDEQKKTDEAKQMYKAVIPDLEKMVPHRDPPVASIWGRYANFEWKQNNYLNAYNAAKKAREFLQN